MLLCWRSRSAAAHPAQFCLLQLRVFALAPSRGFKQELGQSPLVFRESDVSPDQEERIRRKDAIIQTRNAQVRGWGMVGRDTSGCWSPDAGQQREGRKCSCACLAGRRLAVAGCCGGLKRRFRGSRLPAGGGAVG